MSTWKSRARLIAGAILVIVVAYWFVTTFVTSIARPSVEYPAKNAMAILACDGDGVWLSVMEGMPELSAQADPRVVVSSKRADRIPRVGKAQSIAFGPAVARTLSLASDGSRWLVVQQPTDEFDYGGRARLLYAGRDQFDWEERSVPGALIGAAFESDLKGFAWSVDAVFRTVDGGRNWRMESVAPWRVAGPRMPQLIPAAQGGGLLVPLRTPPLADGSSRLLRVGHDGTSEVLGHWDHISIEGAVVAGGDLVVGSRPWLVGPSKVYVARLGKKAPEFREIWSGEKERIQDLQAVGGDVYFIAVGEWGQSGLLGATPKTLMRSAAGNWTWSREDVTEQRVQSLCVGPDGIWTLGGADRHVAFLPVHGKCLLADYARRTWTR
jgi:hypothetical protein